MITTIYKEPDINTFWQKLTFNIAVSDWIQDTATQIYYYNYTNAALTSTSTSFVSYDASAANNFTADITIEENSNGSITFWTEAIPTGTITGTIKVLDKMRGKLILEVNGNSTAYSTTSQLFTALGAVNSITTNNTTYSPSNGGNVTLPSTGQSWRDIEVNVQYDMWNQVSGTNDYTYTYEDESITSTTEFTILADKTVSGVAGNGEMVLTTSDLIQGETIHIIIRITTTGINVSSTNFTLESIGMLDLIYPIGSIYLSLNEINPRYLLGGYWTKLEDRFLLGAGNNYLAATTGGNSTHTLTMTEMPSHTHGWYGTQQCTLSGSASVTAAIFGQSDASALINQGKGPQPAGGNASNNNETDSFSIMPPYLAVYMWKRVGEDEALGNG